ncbi:MAG: hypothetical protein GX904_02650, partial [Acholeplasmataceae bacterium]|nr:hypothetical protein [Acholeplasmataceae bacterium]
EKALKRKLVFSLSLLVISIALFVFSSYAWFTGKYEKWINAEVGFVDVDLLVYFENDEGELVPANEILESRVEVESGVYKPGVYEINIVSGISPNYFEDFRLKIEVSSNVGTYLRIKLYEQLTLTYINYDNSITELSVLIDGFMPFNYDLNNWHDNREIDNYLYYKSPVEREGVDDPLEIWLIESYFSEQNFANYSPGYSLQMTFQIEAVQAIEGPEKIWGMSETPWGTSW